MVVDGGGRGSGCGCGCGSVYYPGPVLPGGGSPQLSADWREENK